MNKYVLAILALLVPVVLTAQKQINDNNAEVRNVKGFHGIKVTSGIRLYLTQGSSEAVAVSASNIEDRDRIRTEVQNGILKIYYDRKFRDIFKVKNKQLKAYVSIVDIDGLDISAGASVNVDGMLNSDKLKLDVSSGAVFKGSVNANAMNVDQSSGSVVTIAGTAGMVNIDGSSGSVFRGYSLEADNCIAGVSSGAGAQITVNKELSAEASSGGSISYKGKGLTRRINTSSGGSVRRKG